MAWVSQWAAVALAGATASQAESEEVCAGAQNTLATADITWVSAAVGGSHRPGCVLDAGPQIWRHPSS
jgi:hypothetical protein